MPRGSRGHPPVLKRLGQHFLSDRAALEAIAAAVSPTPADTVLEIGPGRGALTDILLPISTRLIAIELDRALAANLRERYADTSHVTILENDVLNVDLATLVSGRFVVAGNVPYYITTPILFHVLQPPLPRHAVFLVQREVADRIVASPGTREYGALTVNVQAISSAEIVRNVPASAFRPPPKVDSAIIRITPRPTGAITPDEVRPFRSFVQGIFGMRRKQMGTIMRSLGHVTAEGATATLVSVGIDPAARPETLTPVQFVSLMRLVRKR